MGTVELRVLGSLRLTATDGRDLESLIRQPKRTALLAYLAAAVPRGYQRRDTLLALFWPELDETRARAALNQALYVLRNALGEQAIRTRGDNEVALDGGVVWCDAGAFETALNAGRPTDALQHYGGDLLEGFFVAGAPGFERWTSAERARLRQRASEGAWAVADGLAAQGDAVDATRWARKAADLMPADEAVARRLMTFLHRLGDRAAALRAYEAFAWQLSKEYELEPSAETQDLAAAIRQDDAPARIARARPEPAAPPPIQTPPATRRIRRRLTTVGVVVLAGLAALGVWLRSAAEGAADALPRVVVLPFQNLGPSEEAHLADGITDEITARLGGVSGLRVISRTSAMTYKDRPTPLRQIGVELQVGSVLEGTVRIERSPGGTAQVHVIAQLIRVSDDTHLWNERYSAPLVPGQIVAVQADIAERVAQALGVTLLEPERRSLATPTTQNLRAYDFYLRGKDYRRQGFAESESRMAVRMFEQAIAVDSTFAPAWANLAWSSAQMYWFFYDRSPERLAAMERAAERAQRLSPNDPEVQMALGYVNYWGHFAHDRALIAFQAAARLQPSNSEAHQAIGNVYKRRGAYEPSIHYYLKALALDPRLPHPAHEIANAYALMGDNVQAGRYYDQVASLAPEWPQAYWRRARLHLNAGNLPAARAALAAPAAPAADPSIRYHAVLIEIFDREYEAAFDRIAAAPGDAHQSQWEFVPAAQLRAQVHGLRGHASLRRTYYDTARVVAERRVRARPEEPNYHSALGIAYAGLGRPAEAIAEARKAVDKLPVTADAIRALYRLEDLARVYVMVGDYDAALGALTRLMALPGGPSIPFLELDPVWDPLRGRAEFRTLRRR